MVNNLKEKIERAHIEHDSSLMIVNPDILSGMQIADREVLNGDFIYHIPTESIYVVVVRGADLYYVMGHVTTSTDIVDDVLDADIIPLKVSVAFGDNWLSQHPVFGGVYDFLKTAFTEHPDNNRFVDKIASPTCHECGCALGGSPLETSEDGHIYCNECRERLFRRCARCGTQFRGTLENDDILCPNCAKRNFITPYHRYTPPLKFFGSTNNNTVPYLGVELEVDEGGENDRYAREVVNIMNNNGLFVYCSHDSSLSRGFEIITQPATFKYHTSIKEKYETLFNHLINKGFLSHDTTTCGLHVHFNRDFYADNEELYISHLLYMVEKFWNEMVIFSRRNQYRLDRYAKKIDSPINDYIRASNKNERNRGHYHHYAVNLSNANTIEFRMFKGTLNVNTFIATLQLVNNMIICAKTKTTQEIQAMSFDELITGRICKAYWQKHKGRKNTEE